MDPRDVRMAVTIGGLELANPVMAASGTFGYGQDYAPYVDLDRLGAICTKGLSLAPMPGNPPMRIAETASGMLNTIGLENVGVEGFIEEKLPFLRRHALKVVANIFGSTLEEYEAVAARLDGVPGVHAVELNISCPNVKRGGMVFGNDPRAAAEVTGIVRRATRLPVIVKLSPNVTDPREVARAVEAAGADALSLVNTFVGMAIDLERRRPLLYNATGGLSGPAIKPLALRMVWQVARAVAIPVIGIGGIMTGRDALEFLAVGARAIQVGTANFVNPTATMDVLDEMAAWLAAQGIDDVKAIVGTLDVPPG
ncbi:MAG: dihydroorotate dehydrogenase [Myxococcales bacterium]|nr:dihydroorotate dehydrogenase [Myxococcales bacterium]